jgi:hypothetical protein
MTSSDREKLEKASEAVAEADEPEREREQQAGETQVGEIHGVAPIDAGDNRADTLLNGR